jgi:uncharacterized repeat protein (TIGR03943 family)
VTVDGGKVLRAGVLALWAGFFAYLQVSGEVARYLGPRTYLVATFGAIALTGAALGHLFALKAARPRRLRWREIAGAGLLVAPLVAIAIVPGAELGALAASKKLDSAGGADIGALAPPAPAGDRPISFVDLHFANRSESYASSLGIAEGMDVRLVGFVSDSDDGGSFTLTRFYVSCCAADALPYSVTVDASTDVSYDDDTWLAVRGVVAREGDGYIVAGRDVHEVPEPSNPYLY